MKKKRPAKQEPIDEFYIVAARDVSVDLSDLKDSAAWYQNGDDAIVEAAVGAREDGDGFPQIVYRVTKYVEIK